MKKDFRMGKNVRAILQSTYILLTTGTSTKTNARRSRAPKTSNQDDRLTTSDNPVYLVFQADGIGSAGAPAGANFLHDDSFPATVPAQRELNKSCYIPEVCHSWRLQIKTFADHFCPH